jgi:3-dehydroquinate dehydratase / shikimate dehydrogenase
MTKATLVATLTALPSPAGEELASLPGAIEWLEVRADIVGDLDPVWLRSRFRGQLLYTLRSRAEGGNFNGSKSERERRLLEASRFYDLIDLEGNRDLLPDLLAGIHRDQRVISWSGSTPYHGLMPQFEKLSSVQARLYKLVTIPARLGDELDPLCLLKALGRTDVIAFAGSETGVWTRVVAPHLGAPLVFGTADAGQPANEPGILRLMEDYGLPTLYPLKEIYGIVGSPITHSLSPRLHNAAYRAVGHPALFVSFPVESFPEFWRKLILSGDVESLGLSIRGLTVASPHKEAVLNLAGETTPMVRRAGSSNVLARTNGHWVADTTDPQGVVLALAERGVKMRGKRAAVVGCGGAGRAVAAALVQSGAEVTLVNRGLERGNRASELLGLPFVLLSEFCVGGFSILVNATPLGRNDNQMPFDATALDEDAVVVDLVYSKGSTPLVANATSRGKLAIDGREVLLIQVQRQFRLMTGRKMPEGLAREVLGREPELAALASLGVPS